MRIRIHLFVRLFACLVNAPTCAYIWILWLEKNKRKLIKVDGRQQEVLLLAANLFIKSTLAVVNLVISATLIFACRFLVVSSSTGHTIPRDHTSKIGSIHFHSNLLHFQIQLQWFHKYIYIIFNTASLGLNNIQTRVINLTS